MSEQTQQSTNRCVSCGINIVGMSAATFDCPECGTRIHRCATCRKQSTPYQCDNCGFTGP
jgi:predicted RNA-binding Zn-ribbon protein involved in translation (DUF1610 family)